MTQPSRRSLTGFTRAIPRRRVSGWSRELGGIEESSRTWKGRPASRPSSSSRAVVVPAGMYDIVIEPQYAVNEAKTDYIATIAPKMPKTRLPHPMPIAITVFAGQGDEPSLIKIGTGDGGERHRSVRAPAEYRAHAEDSGAERRRAHPGRLGLFYAYGTP